MTDDDEGRPFCPQHSAELRSALIEHNLGDRIGDDTGMIDRARAMSHGLTVENYDAMILAELSILHNLQRVSTLLTLFDCPLCVGNDMIELGVIEVTDGENFDIWIQRAADEQELHWKEMQGTSGP